MMIVRPVSGSRFLTLGTDTFTGESDELHQAIKGFAVDHSASGWELMSYVSRLGPTAVITACSDPNWADLSRSKIGNGEQFGRRSDTHSQAQ
jgi:hypothetical protein